MHPITEPILPQTKPPPPRTDIDNRVAFHNDSNRLEPYKPSPKTRIASTPKVNRLECLD